MRYQKCVKKFLNLSRDFRERKGVKHYGVL